MPYPTKKLGEIIEFNTGFAFKSQDYSPSGIKVFRVTNIGNDHLPNNKDYKYISSEFYEKGFKKYELFEDDVILVMVGATTGKLGRITRDILPAVLNQNMWNLKIINGNILDKRFLFLSLYFNMPQFLGVMQGAAREFIKQKDFKELSILLPPLQTQQLIVKKLDQAFANIDTQIELLKSSISSIEELNKSVLENFGDFNKVLVGDIVEELFAGGDLPKDGKYSKGKTDEYSIPIFANAIKDDGLYGYTEKPRVIKPAITISARGTIGFTKLRLEPFYPIVRLLVLIPKEKLAELKYLEYILNTINLKQFGSSIPQLSVPQLKSFKIPLPPLEKQKEIVAYLDQVFEKNKALKEKYQTQIQTLQEMKQSLLQDAFEGKLVKE